MTYNNYQTANLVRPLFIVTPSARYVQFSSRVRWLISDDAQGMNSDTYEMYVLSECIRHKYQVKYVSQAPLTRLFFHFNRHHLEQIMDKEHISSILMIMIPNQMRIDPHIKNVLDWYADQLV